MTEEPASTAHIPKATPASVTGAPTSGSSTADGEPITIGALEAEGGCPHLVIERDPDDPGYGFCLSCGESGFPMNADDDYLEPADVAQSAEGALSWLLARETDPWTRDALEKARGTPCVESRSRRARLPPMPKPNPDIQRRATNNEPPLKEQLRHDRVSPDKTGQLQIERELFEDRPPLREPHEAQRQSIEEWIAASGLDGEHRKFAEGAITAIAKDTRKALSIFREGKQKGIGLPPLSEIIREGVIRGQEEIRKLSKAEEPDPIHRFHGLKMLAEAHGLRVNGDFDPAQHSHVHLDELSRVIEGKAAEQASTTSSPQDPKAQDPKAETPQNKAGDDHQDEPRQDAIKLDENGRPKGGKSPTQPHDRHRLQQAIHDVLDEHEMLKPRVQGSPFEEAHKHVLHEGREAARKPSPEALEYTRRRTRAFRSLVTGQDINKSFGMDLSTGAFYDLSGPQPRAAGAIAADIQAMTPYWAEAHDGAIRVRGVLSKADVPQDAIECPVTGGYWMSPCMAEEWRQGQRAEFSFTRFQMDWSPAPGIAVAPVK